MNRSSSFALALALALAPGCRCQKEKRAPAPSPTAVANAAGSAEAEGSPVAAVRCRPDGAFVSSISVPEASAATFVELTRGRVELLVVSDSGNKGAATLVSLMPEGGAAEERGLTLALDREASDDLEGAAARKGAVYTLTSSGSVRRFVSDGKNEPGFVQDGPSYPIGPAPFSCKARDVNCGKNWEGLCLRSATLPGRCAGYAASKQENALYCIDVMNEDGAPRLAVDTVKPPLKLDLPARALADCAFGAEGGPAARILLVTTNVHGGSRTFVVDEATGSLSRVEVAGHVSNEAVALGPDGALYQFMDDNRAPSASSRYVCEGW